MGHLLRPRGGLKELALAPGPQDWPHGEHLQGLLAPPPPPPTWGAFGGLRAAAAAALPSASWMETPPPPGRSVRHECCPDVPEVIR